METDVRLFSEAYSPTKLLSQFTAAVSQSLWEEILKEQETGRSFIRIESNGKSWICPVGQPVAELGEEKTIFLPNWMIDCGNLDGDGDTAHITVLSEEAFPEATKITFRVIDSAFYSSEVKEELESALTSIGVVQKHTLLQIPIEGLGGFQVELFVSHTEPADIVLCNGDEVAVEFEEPVDQMQPPTRPPTPIPPPPVQFPSLMIPSTIPYRRQEGFMPFQGEGRLLGGNPENAPEWRKSIPPKKQP